MFGGFAHFLNSTVNNLNSSRFPAYGLTFPPTFGVGRGIVSGEVSGIPPTWHPRLSCLIAPGKCPLLPPQISGKQKRNSVYLKVVHVLGADQIHFHSLTPFSIF